MSTLFKKYGSGVVWILRDAAYLNQHSLLWTVRVILNYIQPGEANGKTGHHCSVITTCYTLHTIPSLEACAFLLRI